ncbi:ATP-binding protein [uncultured Desulfuromonas sp.]|uniref:sensor histidine kinase n=1 Tax=uncultured Desulfuromonas sp. TaxID=181013 RepID=UPI00262D6881|nr:ATP-binding protein [uncultured Desulfuromonas sp.]
MRRRLLWKLLLVNIVPVIGVIVLVIWLAIDQLAADYFMALMTKYDVSPTDTHQMFLDAVHRYLIWATLAALALALLLSYLLTSRVLRPLSQMVAATREVAAGNFSPRVQIASRDEVGQFGEAFNRMADSLERVEGLRKTMVADVAHELRTPLTNLRGYLEGLSDEVIPPSKATFEMLQDEILRLVHLVDNLQQLARADAARAYLDRRAFALHEAVEQMLGLYGPNFRAKGISVETRFAPGTGAVTADRDKVLQAVRNLVENALKYTPAGGRVAVSAERVSGGIRVVFANTGEGIAEADLPHVFERFYRADRSRSREAGGAGIGLAIVKELVEAHGGRVGAESSGEETQVWFVLPD